MSENTNFTESINKVESFDMDILKHENLSHTYDMVDGSVAFKVPTKPESASKYSSSTATLE